MKKFKFSLSHMLEYKDRILDEEKGKLQRFRAEQTEIENHISRLNSEFQSISSEMKRAQEKGTTIIQIKSYNMQLDSIRFKLKELEADLQKAAKKVSDQMNVVVVANQEVSKLDKLQDKQREDYIQKETKAEELRVEELVVQSITRKNAG